MGKQYKVNRKRRWLRRLAIFLVLAVVVFIVDLGSKLRFSRGVIHGVSFVISLDDSTDLCVASNGFLDYDYEVLLIKRWSLAPEKIMEVGSGVFGSVEILCRRDGQFVALRYAGEIVDHYDVTGQHPGHGPQSYGYSVSDEFREYDKQVKEWLGPDYKVVWKSRYP